MESKQEFYQLIIDDTPYEVKLTPKFLRRKSYVPSDPKKLKAVIPGIIQDIFVKKGQSVKRGDSLLILEAISQAISSSSKQITKS